MQYISVRYTSSNGKWGLTLTAKQVELISKLPDKTDDMDSCNADIRTILQHPEIGRQLKTIGQDEIMLEMAEYGWEKKDFSQLRQKNMNFLEDFMFIVAGVVVDAI